MKENIYKLAGRLEINPYDLPVLATDEAWSTEALPALIGVLDTIKASVDCGLLTQEAANLFDQAKMEGYKTNNIIFTHSEPNIRELLRFVKVGELPCGIRIKLSLYADCCNDDGNLAINQVASVLGFNQETSFPVKPIANPFA